MAYSFLMGFYVAAIGISLNRMMGKKIFRPSFQNLFNTFIGQFLCIYLVKQGEPHTDFKDLGLYYFKWYWVICFRGQFLYKVTLINKNKSKVLFKIFIKRTPIES